MKDLVECINPMTEKLEEIGCMESCVDVEYLAWQMIALLPEKIFSPMGMPNSHLGPDAQLDDGCTRSHLTKEQTKSVINDILLASEIDTRNNRLVRERTKATIAHLRRATERFSLYYFLCLLISNNKYIF